VSEERRGGDCTIGLETLKGEHRQQRCGTSMKSEAKKADRRRVGRESRVLWMVDEGWNNTMFRVGGAP